MQNHADNKDNLSVVQLYLSSQDVERGCIQTIGQRCHQNGMYACM